MYAEPIPAMLAEQMSVGQCRSKHEIFELKTTCGQLINKLKNQEETDALSPDANYSFHYYDIVFTAIAIVSRLITVGINVKLAYYFYQKEKDEYFLWTVICISVPLVVTSMIHCFMCHEDGKFKKSFLNTARTCFWIFTASVFLRYYKSLVYAVRCKRAEQRCERENQIRFYKLAINEESDVAFIKLFECFLEAAPQKILQISIVLNQKTEITDLQILAICIYFASMAWCLTVYHRYVRYSQEDKLNIDLWGHICQLCWHFSTSVSRTLTIAFIASIFPLFTICGCLLHIILAGVIIFLSDRPRFPSANFPNFLFCLMFGVIYLFTYISTRDESTFYKYVVYYATCLAENITCIVLFAAFATNDMKTTPAIFYSLCLSAVAFYFLGIIIMTFYYTNFHPQITARVSKRLITN